MWETSTLLAEREGVQSQWRGALRRAGALLGCAASALVGLQAAAAPSALELPHSVPWVARAWRGNGPEIVPPPQQPPSPENRASGEGAGARWRFLFRAGRMDEVGYVQVPLPGDWLRARGLAAVEVVHRGVRGDGELDVVLVGSEAVYRAPLPASAAPLWTRSRIELEEFRPPPRGSGVPVDSAQFGYLRLESPQGGLERAVTIEVRSVRLHLAREVGEAALPSGQLGAEPPAAARPLGVSVAGGRIFAEGRPFFPFGLFLLGGNRSLLEEIARAGANTVVEYGPDSWPRVAVEDHLDYARACGVRVGISLTAEREGRVEEADARLAPLANDPALLAAYLFDEPDGGGMRGLDPAECSPGHLRERREHFSPAPVLLTCLNSFGMRRYADVAELLAVDSYWPAGARSQFAGAIYSEAAAAVRVATRAGAAPLQVLQLADPTWEDPQRIQRPAVLRAQVLAAAAAGVRGILLFQGATARRFAGEPSARGRLWSAFLRLASEAATWGPLAARWERMPGEPLLEPALGEVRAACFREGGRAWIVLVNLAPRAAEVRMFGAPLEGAERLEDPLDAASLPVRNGEWIGELRAWEGRLLRVVSSGEPQRAVEVDATVPSSRLGRAIVRSDRIVLGATLFPAPEGEVRLFLDGQDVSAGAAVSRGPALVVRRSVGGLARGPHRAVITWEEGGGVRRHEWRFQVSAVRLPFEDRFGRDRLGDAWGIVRDVRWNWRDPREAPAGGTVALEGGELHVRSERGSLGVLLRKVEAPPVFEMRFRARLPRPGEILLQRNELFRRIPLAAGRHQLLLRESPEAQVLFVDGSVRARWHPAIDHRGGWIALGVPGGGEAWFDDFRLAPGESSAPGGAPEGLNSP